MDVQTREAMVEQIGLVRREFRSILQRADRLPAVARVVLKEQALAKSHRPVGLFDRNTCPIIGGETFGHLLVSVTAQGLDALERDIRGGRTKDAIADISTLSRIEPFTAEDAVGTLGVEGLSDLVRSREGESLKVRLFRHRHTASDEAVLLEFKRLLRSMNLEEPEHLVFTSGIRAFRVRGANADAVVQLAKFVGTQAVGLMPQFGVAAQYLPMGPVPNERFPAPDPAIDYPLVGVIDSGTDRTNARLQAWVFARDEDDVPAADQDNTHGSFVAGLVVNGQALNHGDPEFPQTHAKIVDVVAIPKPGTPLYEDQLLHTIRRAVRKFPQVRVWNLSASRTDMVCRDDQFSDFGMELDKIQQDHRVTFVTCAGNFNEAPLRGWPPADLGERDRIHPPADSALAITVGSLAHADRTSSRVRKSEPSPFTRRGPGAAFLPKPEVAHFGGNCDSSLNCHQVGIVSLNGSGQLCEAVGTSFSTPLVSSVLANIAKGVRDPISPNLAKALLVHSAALRGGPVKATDLRYRGFGVPLDVPDILTCSPWIATLILEPTIPPSKRQFARADFPIPRSFRKPDGTVEGDFLMTLVYDPPFDPAAGAEYCQVNIDVSLGTYDPDDSGKPHHDGKIPLEPRDYSKLYEQHLVEWGFKWSPVKLYRKSFEGTSGERWRLKLQMLHRAAMSQAAEPQRAALVISLIDPTRQKPVYNDVVTAMRTSGWVTQDLQIDNRIRTLRRA